MTLRRVAAPVLLVAVAAAGVIGLLAFFNARDDATFAPTARPGEPIAAGAARALAGPGAAAAARRGNVVLLHGEPATPPALAALSGDLGGDEPALRDAGQAVIVVRRRGTAGVVALAAGRSLEVADATDPLLREFAEAWLGRPAPR